MPRPEIFASGLSKIISTRTLVSDHLLVVEFLNTPLSEMNDQQLNELGSDIAHILRFQNEQWKARRQEREKVQPPEKPT